MLLASLDEITSLLGARCTRARTRAGRKGRNSQIVQFEKYWKPNKFCKAKYVIEHDFILKDLILKIVHINVTVI